MNKIILFLLIITTMFSCKQSGQKVSLQGNKKSESCSGDVLASQDTGPLFKLDGKFYSKKELPLNVQEFVYKNNYDAYSKNQAMLKEFALRMYLAKKQNKPTDRDNLPQITELIKVKEVGEKDIKKFFKENKNRMPPTATYKQMKDQIAKYLKGNKLKDAFTVQMSNLEQQGVFTNLISAPEAIKLTIDTKKFPSQGDKNSKIQIIEISDYKCGHCQKAHPMVHNILKQYGNKINFTQINYSLNPTGDSGTFVRGGFCANLQGEKLFWKYHNQAFTSNSVPHKHVEGHAHSDGIKETIAVAKLAGLNLTSFKKCLSSKDASDFVTKTNQMLASKGINSTPVFILQSKKLPQGIYQLESELKKLIK